MKLVINSEYVALDEVSATMSIQDIARQFTLVDISSTQKYFKGDVVEIYDNSDVLQIKAEIEYVKATGDDKTSEFIYAGRNNAKYIVDCYADKTIQFTENQKLNTVLDEIAKGFGLKITGDAQLPKNEIKTILIGDNIGEAFVEIVHSAGQIITSDAIGNIVIQDKADVEKDIIFEYGKNVRKRNFIEDTTEVYDKYVVVSQSNYLIKQSQDANVQGSYGSGKFVKVMLSKHTLTETECEKLAEIEFKKDTKNSFDYSIVTDETDLILNAKYTVIDKAIGLNEVMKLRTIEMTKSTKIDEVRIYLEKIL